MIARLGCDDNIFRVSSWENRLAASQGLFVATNGDSQSTYPPQTCRLALYIVFTPSRGKCRSFRTLVGFLTEPRYRRQLHRSGKRFQAFVRHSHRQLMSFERMRRNRPALASWQGNFQGSLRQRSLTSHVTSQFCTERHVTYLQ